MYIRYPLSLRNVEDFLHERGIEISHETVLFWWHRLGPLFTTEIRKRQVSGMRSSRWRWHPDEVFVKINGEWRYLWRALTSWDNSWANRAAALAERRGLCSA